MEKVLNKSPQMVAFLMKRFQSHGSLESVERKSPAENQIKWFYDYEIIPA